MRYIMLNEFANQWADRKQYIFFTMKLWTYLRKYNDSFVLTSIPSISLDIVFIVGHNSSVYHYLKQNHDDITEKTIIIITCNKNYNYASVLPPDKSLYLCLQSSSGIADLYDGYQYNIPFDITESELLFYNCREPDIHKKIDKCFSKYSDISVST